MVKKRSYQFIEDEELSGEFKRSKPSEEEKKVLFRPSWAGIDEHHPSYDSRDQALHFLEASPPIFDLRKACNGIFELSSIMELIQYFETIYAIIYEHLGGNLPMIMVPDGYPESVIRIAVILKTLILEQDRFASIFQYSIDGLGPILNMIKKEPMEWDDKILLDEWLIFTAREIVGAISSAYQILSVFGCPNPLLGEQPTGIDPGWDMNFMFIPNNDQIDDYDLPHWND